MLIDLNVIIEVLNVCKHKAPIILIEAKLFLRMVKYNYQM